MKPFVRNCTANSPFCDFNYVFIHYCSSHWWGGDNGASRNTANYHFRGKNIVQEVINEIHSKALLPEPSKVVFWGTSAGGVGAMTNADRAGSIIKELYGDGVDFRAMMDGSWFMGGEVFKKHTCTNNELCAVEHRFSHGYSMWNQQVNEQCALAYEENDRWRCMQGEVAVKYLRSEFFSLISTTDAW